MLSPRRKSEPPSRSSRPAARVPKPPLKGAKAKVSKVTETPLGNQQQALRDQEEQLRQASDKLKQLIEGAPLRREEQTRRRREQLAGDTRLSRNSLVDKRHYGYNVSTTADSNFGQRRLRSEKRDGKVFFIFLCVVLACVLLWVYQVFVGRL